jgi:hypothetical protein
MAGLVAEGDYFGVLGLGGFVFALGLEIWVGCED